MEDLYLFGQNIDQDFRSKFKKHIEDNGLRAVWVANRIGVAYNNFSKMLNLKLPMTEKNRQKCNEVLKTDY